MIPLTPVKLYAVLAIIGLLLLGLVIQTQRLEAVKTEYATFASEVEQVGKLAVAAAEKQELEDKLKKEKADAENLRTLNAVRADNDRLRSQRVSRGYLPAAPADSRSPETACFGRAQLEQAVRQLDEGVSGLIAECTETAVNLNTAKRWASSSLDSTSP